MDLPGSTIVAGHRCFGTIPQHKVVGVGHLQERHDDKLPEKENKR